MKKKQTGSMIAAAVVAGAALIGSQGLPGAGDLLTGSPTDRVPVAPASIDLVDRQAPITPGGNTTADSVTTAWAQLHVLDVKGRAPKTGYDRDRFGQRWSDDVDVEYGRNGCDTRNDILRRDLYDVTIKPNTNGCVALTGTLDDPFTGRTIDFRRGSETSGDVQIDHVVSLSDAWQKGAQQLTEQQRMNFANDPINLLAVEGRANQQKSDGDAATWQPPNKAFRCTLAMTQINVKHTYGLWVTEAERDALARQLETC